MKQFVFGIVLASAVLAIAEGGYRLDWKQELSHKENQQVFVDFIQSHCHIVPVQHIVPSDGSKPYDIEARINCYAYDEK